MLVLAVNVGSSSVKLGLLDAHDATVAARELDATDPGAAVVEALAKGPLPDAIGHRFVHGGSAGLLGRPAADLRLVICHLGAGSSAAAVAGGRSVDTTMGFTPLEGLVMARRSGTVDPGLLLWLERRQGVDPAELEHMLEHESG